MADSPVRPIRPVDVKKLKKDLLPDAVIAAFNECIAANYSGGISIFLESEVVKVMKKKGLKVRDIYDKGYLDIETIYNRWDVDYDSPAMGESYPATFTFKEK